MTASTKTFHEVRFPFALALGASGGPERKTDIIPLQSGGEARNTAWADSRRRWNAGPGVQTLDDLQTLIAFFEARRGALHGFRFRDPLDNRSCAPSAQPSATDQHLGQGDGTQTRFALVKHYESGGETWTRRIFKPVAGSLRAAIDGVEQPAELDPQTGDLVFADPPPDGASVTAGFAFDCPVRFDTDRLGIALDMIGAGSVPDVPLIELKL